MDKQPDKVNLLVFFKVFWVVPLIFTCGLGVSLVHYLGGEVNFINLVLGIFICLLIFAMRLLLNAYFDHPESPLSTLHKDDPMTGGLRGIRRSVLLQNALLVLTSGAMLTAVLIARKALTVPGLLFLGFALVGYFICASPPFRLDKNGYGDLVEGVVTANLVPAFMMSLLGLEVPFLLLQLTLPLLMLYLAAKIAFAFRDFGLDSLYARNSLVTRMGWQNTVVMHNLLILGAFVLIGAFLLLGLPWSLAWPMLLALPVGLFQLWQMNRIAAGAKPGWKLFLWTAMGLVLLTAYLIQVPLWT